MRALLKLLITASPGRAREFLRRLGLIRREAPRSRNRLLEEGLEAEAIILQVRFSAGRRSTGRIRLSIQVQPESGKSFITELRLVARQEQLPQFTRGSHLRVKYDVKKSRERIRLSPDIVPSGVLSAGSACRREDVPRRSSNEF